MTLFLEQDEYMSVFGQEAGVVVTINSPEVTPLSDDEGITIRPGVVASIGIRYVRSVTLVHFLQKTRSDHDINFPMVVYKYYMV